MTAGAAIPLRELDALPPGFAVASARDLLRLVGGPALIHLEGRRRPALFVSILLHGNETTGLLAVQRVLAMHAAHGLPRAMTIFVGNVAAAAQGLRRLDGQADYNRVWPGSDEPRGPEHVLAEAVTETMRRRGLFASIDIHNNTGSNPLYGCIPRLEDPFRHLAALFSRTAVWFRTPRGVQVAAFAPLAPSITLECGKPGSEPGVTRAAALVDACLRLEHFPRHPPAPQDLDLFHTVATVKLPPDQAFGFGDSAAPLVFPADVDRLNFRELEAGTLLGRAAPGARLDVRDESGADVFDAFLRIRDGRLETRRAVMPAMLTLDERIVRQDCLCYLMERVPAGGAGRGTTS